MPALTSCAACISVLIVLSSRSSGKEVVSEKRFSNKAAHIMCTVAAAATSTMTVAHGILVQTLDEDAAGRRSCAWVLRSRDRFGDFRFSAGFPH
jgi:hypothetical protein